MNVTCLYVSKPDQFRRRHIIDMIEILKFY